MSPSVADKHLEYLSTLGYPMPGSIADLELAYWNAGGGGSSEDPVGGPGRYILNPGNTTPTQPTGGDLRAWAFRIPQDFNVTKLEFNVSTLVAASVMDFAFYDQAGDILTRRHALGTADCSTTGIKTLAGSWLLTKGVWWIAYASAAGSIACTCSTDVAQVGGPEWTPGSHPNAITLATFGGRWSGTSCPATLTGAAAQTVGNDCNQIRIALTIT